MTRHRIALAGLALLTFAVPVTAQQSAGDEPARVEQVFIPEEAFEEVLKRYPRGVIVKQDELLELLRRAGRRPADAPQQEVAPPVASTIERVSVRGEVVGMVATLRAEASVQVLTDQVVILELPLKGLGLTRLTVDGKDGRLIRTRNGAAVLLEGAVRERGAIVPARRVVAWEFATRVKPGDERGSGEVSFPVPAAASGHLELRIEGDLEVRGQGGLVWVGQHSDAETVVEGAFGGTAAGHSEFKVSWSPRRAGLEVTPYVVADTRGIYLVRQGVVTLESTVRIGVYRSHRDTFAFDLPAGFVVRELVSAQGELTYAQKGDRVEARLSAPLEGLLEFRLRAELPIGSDGEAEEVELRPLGLPGVDRVTGMLGIARGEGSVVDFLEVSDLDQSDLSRLGGEQAQSLLRVYGHAGHAGRIKLRVERLRPEVDLELKAAFQLEEREVRALAAYRFVVRKGKVFALRVQLPEGYELDRVVLRDENRREPRYELRMQTTSEDTPRPELLIELQNGLRAGQELLVTVQAHHDLETPLGTRRLAVPRLSGSPASRVSGYLGFAPDEAYRLKSAQLDGLTAIPAEELPRAGLDVPGLVLGYRVEDADYNGRVLVERRTTRVSARALVRHRVVERIIRTDTHLDLEIEGAPVEAVELLLPEGVERMTRVSGGDARWEDRERLGAADGRVRWKVPFEGRKVGLVSLRVQFETKLPAGEQADEVTLEALPKVSLAGAFRERGTIAIYSGGMTEIEPTPRGVQPIEVTEVQSPEGEDERPLFAYTYVGQDYGVGLSIRRHPASEILSALAERLDLLTTADAEGVSRHTATFTVKNLDNQFFTLRLPTGAKLWSVVVDGTGVKPAERNGLMIVPIASAGTKGPDDTTTISATYTLGGEAWGNMGELSLVAPELMLDEEHTVPVLATRWELAMPEDYRVLEYGGNVKNHRGGVAVAPLFTKRVWRALKRADLEWLLIPLLLGLLAAASLRVRTALLVLLGGVAGAAAGAGRGVQAFQPSRGAKLVFVGVVGLGLLGSCTVMSMRGSRSRRMDETVGTAYAPRSAAEAYDQAVTMDTLSGGEDVYEEEERQLNSGRWESKEKAQLGRLAPAQAPTESDAWGDDDADGEMAEGEAMPPPARRPRAVEAPRPAEQAAKKAEDMRRQRGLAPPPAAEPAPMDMDPAMAPADDAPMMDMDEAGAGGSLSFDDEPSEDAKGDVVGRRGGTKRNHDRPVFGHGAGERADRQNAPATSLPPAPKRDRGLTAEELGLVGTDSNQPTTISAIEIPGSLGQVGLRSLVLTLDAVGKRASFSRPGGGAMVSLSFVKESLLSVAGGFLALLGFLAAFGLPRWGKVSYAGLLLVSLATLTALPLVAAPLEVIPLLNALAFGVAVAAPVHLAVAAFRWLSTRPLARLRRTLSERQGGQAVSQGTGRSGATAALVLVAGLGFAQPASAQEAPAPQGPRVYVPYDPAQPDQTPDRVFVPGEVYEDLWKRAFPSRVVVVKPKPAANYVVNRVDYVGGLEGGELSLEVTVRVDVLAEGWQRVPLGLSGVGLNGSTVRGGEAKARVLVAPAGGFELVARGPASYEVVLDVKAPQMGRGYAFATVPALVAKLELTSDLRDRRVVVGGAKAQVERELEDGRTRVEASLGDAGRVQLSFPGRAVLATGGASEASANTRSIAWARRGRVLVVSVTEFAVAGAGREGFVFKVPEGLEVLAVQTQSLRDWQVGEGRLEIRLRRPSGSRHSVQVWAEKLLARDATEFDVPHLEAQGVRRESGSFGLASEDGIRMRAKASGGVTQYQGNDLSALVGALSRAAKTPVRVETAFRFNRRPSRLRVDLVHEPAEVKAEVTTGATFLHDRTRVRVLVKYEVRRGKVYQLELAVPADLELIEGPKGLDVRETSVSEPKDDARIYRMGLASGLTGPGQVELVFQRRHVLTEALRLDFPDVRPLGVAYETGTIGLAVAPGLRLSVPREPQGLGSTNPRSVSRRMRAPAGGAQWTLAYRRANNRRTGLAQGTVQLRRPEAEVTGSWVLHALVERDVVRYELRALYTIENAGARRFQVRLPASVGDRFTVEATNLREYRSAGNGDSQLVTVELQSPAEGFYDLALSWEEILQPGKAFSAPAVGIESVDQFGRGYVLVEKAPEVSDILRQVTMEGAVERGRASDAPALPPGRETNDFAFVYRVMLKDRLEWAVSSQLESPGALSMPAPARIPYAHLTSVITGQGRARHRATYRVRNQRLQFLSLLLPTVSGVAAEVWSVHVAGEARRPHQLGGELLIPLPKRTDADLSFDVEVIYATPMPGSLGFGGEIDAQAPTLKTEGVEIERTFWTLYLPSDYDYSGFGGNLEPASEADMHVQALTGDVRELRELEELVRNSSGNTQAVANDNVLVQLERIEQQLLVCKSNVGQGSGQAWTDLGKNSGDVDRLRRLIGERVREQEAQQQQQLRLGDREQAQVLVEGQNFQQMASGWYSNDAVNPDNSVQWVGVQEDDGRARQQESAWTLTVPEGLDLDLQNAEVFKGRELQQQQGQAGGANYGEATGLLGNRNYQSAFEQGQQVQAEREALELLQESVGRNVIIADKKTDLGGLYRATSSAGRLSMRVRFETPGRAFHFATTDSDEPARVSVSSYPRRTAERGVTIARGVVLVLLLVGVFRLGLLAPAAAGGHARQILLLIGAGALAVGVFVHLALAGLAALVGILAVRYGPGAAAA